MPAWSHCPPGFDWEGRLAPPCPKGGKFDRGLSIAGAAHSRTCPHSRAWPWARLGRREPMVRAVYAAWQAHPAPQ